ncbi:MAG: hypothetical protein EB111_02920 [Actinobacteria bacterium]|nr:hypothetical protein [Actinomycetota bacterium]
MRRLVACCFATTLLASMMHAEAVAALVVKPSAGHSMNRRGSVMPSLRSVMPGSPDVAVLDRLVFSTPLQQFRIERSRAKRLHRWIITATDGCTAPLIGSSGKSFDFRVACERHDLAYANYSTLSRMNLGVEWDAALRARVDDQFQRDLQESCLRRRHSERLRCDAWVVVFFHAVRLAAGP